MQQFYDAIDVSKTGFYAMEENNTLNMKTLERISETLDVPLSYWFSTEDASTSPAECMEKLVKAQDRIIELQQEVIRLSKRH